MIKKKFNLFLRKKVLYFNYDDYFKYNISYFIIEYFKKKFKKNFFIEELTNNDINFIVSNKSISNYIYLIKNKEKIHIKKSINYIIFLTKEFIDFNYLDLSYLIDILKVSKKIKDHFFEIFNFKKKLYFDLKSLCILGKKKFNEFKKISKVKKKLSLKKIILKYKNKRYYNEVFKHIYNKCSLKKFLFFFKLYLKVKKFNVNKIIFLLKFIQ
ncbi:hypothetical protein [Candidatus Vidania fulgoroideorum]